MNDSPDLQTPEDIWVGDLLKRREEAELLISYIESVSQRRWDREDSQGFTIAIDAEYGYGKSFFLKRLAAHLALNHPVAFVDAWRDDIADEPLVALAATLKKALKPILDVDPTTKGRWDDLASKVGKVSWIASKGLLRKVAATAISATAVDAVEDLLSGKNDKATEVIQEHAKKVGEQSLSGLDNLSAAASPNDWMKKRISEFEEGITAIDDFKNGLKRFVESLNSKHLHVPIIIIVDELDRCRPTYAIKLLEEIKHIFDVSDVVFILGIHREQLNHSIRACYGLDFNGYSYLDRFISRTYRLKEPNLEPLITILLEQSGIDLSRFEFPHMSVELKSGSQIGAYLLSSYMEAFGLTVRHSFSVIDKLQTCAALTGTDKLVVPYLFPLIMGQIQGANNGAFKFKKGMKYEFFCGYDQQNSQIYLSPERLAQDFVQLCDLSFTEISKINSKRNNWAISTTLRPWKAPLSSPLKYRELIESIARFEQSRGNPIS